MKKKKSFLTRNILLLSLVSFFTDIASEMLYPIMPIYLRSIGYGVLVVGIIEGIAEATAGLNKVFFGHLSDKTGKRNFFVRLGYGISTLTKPLIGFSTNASFIFFIRFLDRIGKGIRTAPRDAILTAESHASLRGRVFGFHRSMDTFGAMLGPIITLLFLYYYPLNYSKLFIFAFIPGIIAFCCTFLLLREKNVGVPKRKSQTVGLLKAFWKKSSTSYKKLIVGFLLLALLNSSNAFLLLRAKDLGFSDISVVSAYIVYNLVFALVSYPLGVVSDRIGFKPVFLSGIAVFSLVYSLFGQGFESPLMLFSVFALYGIFGAVDEGVGKAWLTLHIPSEYKATGLGLHLTLNSLGFLFASVVAGSVWQFAGAQILFSVVSLGGILVLIYFFVMEETHISKS